MNKEKIDSIMIVNDNAIHGFFNEYRFLSNYHVCNIVYEDISYTSTEAAYQAAKFLDPQLRKMFSTRSPSEAKKAGQFIGLREDWEEVKRQVMFDVCYYKFSKHLDLRDLLLKTGDKYLEETNWWKDQYWGVYNGVGHNWLGKTLMNVRESLR